MKRNSARFAVAILLGTALLTYSPGKPAFAQDATHQAATQKTGTRVSIGVWGGPDLEMQVTQQGAELQFDCARGTISQPLLLDKAGKFKSKGSFQTQAGPARIDRPPRGADAVYVGTVHGDTMQLELKLSDKESPENFTLVRGQTGNLKKCY